jgi:hypothetical protein
MFCFLYKINNDNNDLFVWFVYFQNYYMTYFLSYLIYDINNTRVMVFLRTGPNLGWGEPEHLLKKSWLGGECQITK